MKNHFLNSQIKFFFVAWLINLVIGLCTIETYAQLTYCIPTTTLGCSSNDHITNVTFGTFSNNTGVCMTNSYSNYTSLNTGNFYPGTTYSLSISVANGGQEYAGAWIDYNQNGIFDGTEFISLTDADGMDPWIYTGAVSIPLSAISGCTRLRCRSSYNTLIGANSACATYSYGETEDYTICTNAYLPCSGTPTPGNTIASSNPVCIGNTVTLSLQNASIGSDITYQWYNNGGAIAGATNDTYTVTITSPDCFYCDVTCINSFSTASSNFLCISLGANTTSNTFQTTCCSYTWPCNNVTYTTSGIYTCTSLNASGCLHTATLNLTVHYNTSHSTYITATNPYTWACNNITYNASGNYTCTNLNVQGCVHTETLVLTIGTTTTNPNNVTACDSYTWSCNNITYTSSGVYTCTSFISACNINTATLNLTIKHSSSSTTAVTKCDSYFWPVNGQTYTASGTYSKTFINAVGCDSTSFLVLTIDPNYFTLTLAVDQPISCHGSSDGSIQVIGNGCGTFQYSIDGGPYGDPCQKFNKLSCGTHTVCMTNGTVIVCETITLLAPDPLFPILITDSYVSSAGNDGALSAIISGGTNSITDYYTFWRNASGTLLNPIPDHHSAFISGLSTGTYSLTVEDDHGCFYTTSTNLSTGANSNVTLYLKCFIEGYWNGSNAMNPVLENQFQPHDATSCDTITVELHDQNAPYGIAHSFVTNINKNGMALCSFPLSTAGNPYYIVVKHRNALQTWSANPVYFGQGATLYDFSTAASKAYCSNQVLITGCGWAFYSGDVNQDGNIDLLDLSSVESAIVTFSSGYTPLDLNGDGNVDILDSSILFATIEDFIFSCSP